MDDSLVTFLGLGLTIIMLVFTISLAVSADRNRQQLGDYGFNKLTALEQTIHNRRYAEYAQGKELTGAKLREILMENNYGAMALRVDGTNISAYWQNHSVSGNFSGSPVGQVYTIVNDADDLVPNIVTPEIRSRINVTAQFKSYGLYDSTSTLVGIWFKEE